MAKNPLIAGLIGIIPQAIGVISSIVKDKKEKKEAEKTEVPTTTAEAVVNQISGAVSGTISSKRIMNIGGTGLIVTLAMGDITAHGLSKMNLALIVIGVAYSIGMTFITYLSEKK